MLRALLLFLFVGIGISLTGQAPNYATMQSPAERAAILAPVTKLFAGMNAADTTGLSAMFHPEGTLSTVMTRGAETRVQTGSLGQFLTSVASANAGDYLEELHYAEVRRDGKMATAWTPYTFVLKGQVSHCGVNLFTLTQTGPEDSWQIYQIIDTRSREGCVRATTPVPDPLSISKQIEELANKWHLAAAEADAETYFGLMGENSIFIGTDATEHWTKSEFEAFAKPYFERGRAWDFKHTERHIFFNPDANTAYWDELLATWMGPCRGTGIATRQNDGSWLIQHYTLSVTVPNERIQGFIDLTQKPTLKALIIDGQNNHEMWPKTTMMMEQYLEETGLFDVDVVRTAYTWKGESLLADFPLAGTETEALPEPKADPAFAPNFADYDVVISNFGWNAAPWPEATQNALEQYIEQGGGLVIVHAADNSFGDWENFNKMIGLGGWGGRNEKSGPYVYFNKTGTLVRDMAPGNGGSHGPQHEFQVMIREEHPITQGMPEVWLHAKDELYDRLRGPAENLTVLATAFSAEDKKGTGRHEPMLMTIDYGNGRIFHTPMGHADYSMECVGFIVALQRGTEWAATGMVSQPTLPADFPTADTTSSRSFTWRND